MIRRLTILSLILPSTLWADDLQPLGDEFDDSASLSQWQDLGVVEGWGTPSVEAADIDTTTPGHFRVQPGALTWFSNLRGALFFKEVTGDYIVTLRLRVLSRHNPANPMEVPNRSFSLSGVFVHGPRGMTQAAPDPYTTNAVWPPGDFGSDWLPNTENYIFLSYGSAGNPGTRQFEIKATRNSDSRLYFDSTGIDQSINEAWLQMIRVGDTVVCLRKHSAAGPWVVENRYPNADHPFPDFGETLQVGITAYTDWNAASSAFNSGVEAMYHHNYAPPAGQPDLVSEVDYYRFQRPHADLTEAVLQAMTVSYDPASNSTASPPVLLAASPVAAPHLGDHANTPVGRLLVEGIAVTEGQGQAMIAVNRSGSSEGAVSCAYQFLPGTATAEDFTATDGTLSWGDGDNAAKFVPLTIINDGIAEGDQTLEMHLNQLDGPANFAGGQLSRTIMNTLHDHPIDQWRLDQFGVLANAPEGQLAGDFDGDDLPNLIERVLGTNPTIADSDTITASQSNDRFELTFTPSVDALDTELVVEACDDLVAENWVLLATRPPGGLEWVLNDAQANVSVDEGTGEVIVRDAVALTAATRRFLRLVARVTL